MPISLSRPDGHPGVQLATVTGEIDIATAGALEQGLVGATAAGDAVVVDLSRVTFIDSSGLHALDHARQAAAAGGTRLVLAGATEQLRRVLSITALLDSFELQPDVEGALAELAGP